jgi:tetratricopeptide (TPR) repeat protein
MDSTALAAFEKVIEQGRGMAWSAYFNRGIMLLERGFEEQAVKDLETAARYRPSRLTTETWIKLGKVLEKINRRELAVELLSLGTGEPAFDAACWRILGRLQIQTGHSRKAVESLENALRVGGEDYHTLVMLGLAGQQAGFVKKAIESYRHALGLSGENRAEILNNLGQVLAETGKLNQAEESYREALQIRSDYIDAWVNLAILYRKEGDFSGARRSIERALELCAGRPDSAGLKEYLQAILDRLPPG